MQPIIDSQQLRTFVTLARTLNMTRAAEMLGLTPSAISHGLKALETDLGCRLFERSSRQFTLSAAGKRFLGEAEQILAQMKAARSGIHAWTDWRRGQLRLGASGTACQFILPPTLREFRESFPGFTIKIEQCSSRQAVSLIAEEQLDLALGTDPAGGTTLEFSPIGEDDLQFYVHPLHPWAVKRKPFRDDIPRHKLILPEKSSNTYALIEAYFREENIRIQPFIEIANEEAIKEFVRLDLGVGILPRWLAADDVQAGRLVGLPLGRRRLKRHWGILYSKTRKLSLAENLFVNIGRKVFREITETNA
ncbi:MAG TPA: LysR family transcriptional regulator [Verrucomicrobiae bacterium]|nr:LysR family transcriptional regulator [Verrucomicrobiae bacterium]